MRAGPWRRLSTQELVFWTVVLGKTLKSPLDCKTTNQSYWKSTLNIYWKDWCWTSNTLDTWWEKLTHWKRPQCWEGLGAGEGGNRGWDGWMASPTRWTWVWVNSGSWWWTRRPGMLWFMGSQRFRHDWATELNWAALCGPVIRNWRFCCLWPRFNLSLGNWHLRSCTVQLKKKNYFKF